MSQDCDEEERGEVLSQNIFVFSFGGAWRPRFGFMRLRILTVSRLTGADLSIEENMILFSYRLLGEFVWPCISSLLPSRFPITKQSGLWLDDC